MAKYRLQTLLEIKERAEQEAKDEFGRAQAELRAQEQLLADMEQELVDMVADRERRRDDYSKKLASGEMKITEQSSAYRFIDRLKERESEQEYAIEGQRENVRNAEKELKRAQDFLIEATQELKAIEKHKEKWAAQVKKERAQREADQMDEIGQIIFNSKK